MNEFYSFIDGKKTEVKFINEKEIFVNGEMNPFSLLKIDSNNFSIIYKNKNFNCRILEKDKNRSKIFVNGSIYLVDCKTKIESIAEQFTSNKKEENQNIVKVFAPMSGLVLKILIGDGEIVKKDQPIIILEAMKMENEILAPADGKLLIPDIKEGITIEKNTKLFEINNLLFEKNY